MIIMFSLIGFLIFTALWFGLDNIKIELRCRNTLLEEQNKILKECLMCNEEKDCEGHNVCEDCGGRSF